MSGFNRLHEFANPFCGSKMPTSGECFEKDAVLVSEIIKRSEFMWRGPSYSYVNFIVSHRMRIYDS